MSRRPLLGGTVSRRERTTWLVPLALALGTVAPAVCVLWFMTEGARNQADAARQRLADAWQGQLRLLADRLGDDWRSRVARLARSAPADAVAFEAAVTSGDVDAIVFLASPESPGYPTRGGAASPRRRPEEPDGWHVATALTAGGSHRAAASQFGAVARGARAADLSARAAQGQVRSLLLAGDRSEAFAALERHLESPLIASGRDRHGRSIVADLRLLAVQMSPPGSQRAQAHSARLAALLDDYDTTTLASPQRLFLMRALIETGAPVALPTYAAERLAAEFLQNDGVVPGDESLQPAGLPGLWKLRVRDDAVALFTTDTVVRLSEAVLNRQDAKRTPFVTIGPGARAGSESVEAPMPFPGWRIGVSSRTLEAAAAERQPATYLWAGSIAVGGLAVGGLLIWQAFRRQQRVSRLKTDLVAAVTHELRTPLTSMRALVDLMLDDPGMARERRAEYLQMIAGENARLSRLIEHFLTFTRIEGRGAGLVLRDVSPAAVVDEATTLSPGRPRFAGLVVDVAPNLPAVYGDHEGLVTVLLNLLENAYKYSGEEKRIVLRARRERDTVSFDVDDNGIGIEARDLKRIFRPFYQVDQRLARERGGCGLGLSIVDHIVRAHRGTVTVRSTPGSGSLFRVALPARITRREAAA